MVLGTCGAKRPFALQDVTNKAKDSSRWEKDADFAQVGCPSSRFCSSDVASTRQHVGVGTDSLASKHGDRSRKDDEERISLNALLEDGFSGVVFDLNLEGILLLFKSFQHDSVVMLQSKKVHERCREGRCLLADGIWGDPGDLVINCRRLAPLAAATSRQALNDTTKTIPIQVEMQGATKLQFILLKPTKLNRSVTGTGGATSPTHPYSLASANSISSSHNATKNMHGIATMATGSEVSLSMLRFRR